MYGDGLKEVRPPTAGVAYKPPPFKEGDLVRACYGWVYSGVVGVFLRTDKIESGRQTAYVCWIHTIGKESIQLCMRDYELRTCSMEEIETGAVEVVTPTVCRLRSSYRVAMDMIVWCYARGKETHAISYAEQAMLLMNQLAELGDRLGVPGAYVPGGG